MHSYNHKVRKEYTQKTQRAEYQHLNYFFGVNALVSLVIDLVFFVVKLFHQP